MQALDSSLVLVATRLSAFQDALSTEVRIALNGDSRLIMSRYTSPRKSEAVHKFTVSDLEALHQILSLLSRDSSCGCFTTGATIRIQFRADEGEITREIPEPNGKEKRQEDKIFMTAWRAIHLPFQRSIQNYKNEA